MLMFHRGDVLRVTALTALGAVMLAAVPAGAAEMLVTIRAAGTNKVLEFDATTGAFIKVFADNPTSGLLDPRGILLGPDGNVYVASYGTDSVKKYSSAGTYLGDFVAAGSGGLDGPEGMCWGPDGNLYVSSSLNDRVIRYQGPGGASPGALIGTFVTAGSGGLDDPRGLMFGQDQYTGQPTPGPAQDGYPELLVCSWGTSQILRYNGQTNPSLAAGAFVDVYGNLPGGNKPNHLVLETAYEDSYRYDRQIVGNLLVSMDGGNIIGIFSGTHSLSEYQARFGGDENYFGPFFGTNLSSPRGMAWGPDRGSDDTVGKYDGYQDLYIANYLLDNIPVAGGDETNLGILVTAGTGGLDGPAYLAFKCGDQPPTLVRKVLGNSGMLGTATHTVRLQGDNLTSLLSGTVKLRRMRQGSGLGLDGTSTVTGTNLRMDGSDLLVDFNLTVDDAAKPLECGRYMVQPSDACGIVNWFPEAVLVYAPELLNPGFEEGWIADRESQYICADVGANGNKSRPKHWDVKRIGSQDQLSVLRDGNIWHICRDGVAQGMTGDHYGSIQCNISNDDQIIMWQTIAAPDVSSQPYRVYVDAHIASFEQLSYGYIRLIDGIDRNGAGALIAQTQIPNTQSIDPDALVRDPSFMAEVPQGYVFQSSPPLLTVVFVLQSVTGDECAAGVCAPIALALKAFHLDAVRNQFQPCPNSPWADTDDDDDVDSDDFAFFQRCLTLGLNPPPMDPACLCLDRNGDDLIDIDNDFVQFQLCGTGPGVTTVAPGCE